MADQQNDRNIQRDPKQMNSRYDPEKEIPDPEQVESDRHKAEEIYGENQRKNPAA